MYLKDFSLNFIVLNWLDVYKDYNFYLICMFEIKFLVDMYRYIIII